MRWWVSLVFLDLFAVTLHKHILIQLVFSNLSHAALILVQIDHVHFVSNDLKKIIYHIMSYSWIFNGKIYTKAPAEGRRRAAAAACFHSQWLHPPPASSQSFASHVPAFIICGYDFYVKYKCFFTETLLYKNNIIQFLISQSFRLMLPVFSSQFQDRSGYATICCGWG